MKKYIILTLLIGLSLFLVCYSGCKKKTVEEIEQEFIEGLGNIGVKGLQGNLDRFELPEDATQRGKKAIEQWNNKTIDPMPILLYTIIKKDNEDIPRICIYFSDEDRDVVGFGIREIYKSEDKESQITEETYPVFIDLSPPTVWMSVFEFKERNLGTKKNEQLWEQFMDDPAAETLPPIIASIPDPNNVDVWLWLYDRAGNKSELVKAVEEIKLKAENKPEQNLRIVVPPQVRKRLEEKYKEK